MEKSKINEAISLATGRMDVFSSSLDAMHEAENTLTQSQTHTFHAHLADSIARDGSAIPTWHATSRHRAEAFLRTLNLWT